MTGTGPGGDVEGRLLRGPLPTPASVHLLLTPPLPTQDPPSRPGSGASLPPEFLPSLPFQARHVEPPSDADAVTPGVARWTHRSRPLHHGGLASARLLPEGSRGRAGPEGPPSRHPLRRQPSSMAGGQGLSPPLGLRGQKMGKRWDSSWDGQRNRVEEGKPYLGDTTLTGRCLPASTLGPSGGSGRGLGSSPTGRILLGFLFF